MFRRRIVRTCSIPLLLWLIASGLVYGNVRLLYRRRDGVGSQAVVVASAESMAALQQQMLESTASFILLRDNQLLFAYDEAWQLFEKHAAFIEQDNPNQVQRQLLGEIRSLAARAEVLNRQSFDYALYGNVDRATRVLASSESRQLQKRFGELLRNFAANEKERLAVLERSAKASLDAALWWTIVSIVTAAFLTLAWGAWVVSTELRSARKVVLELATTAMAVSQGVQENERAAARAANLVELATASLSQLGVASDLSARQVFGARDRLETLAEKMVFLRQLLEPLHVVTNVVNDIAQMANALALSTGVEALRLSLASSTGGEGKGIGSAFQGGDLAIVAADIRQLAERTQKSAQQINDIIADIQNRALALSHGGLPRMAGDDDSDLALALQDIEQMVNTLGQYALGVAQLTEAMQTLQTAGLKNRERIGQTTIQVERLKDSALHLCQVFAPSSTGIAQTSGDAIEGQ